MWPFNRKKKIDASERLKEAENKDRVERMKMMEVRASLDRALDNLGKREGLIENE